MAHSYRMTLDGWAQALSGDDCPFCAPRADDNDFWLKVETLPSSTLYLSRDQRFHGRCLLIHDRGHPIGIESLSPRDAASAFEDLHRCSKALRHALRSELVNVASLGNQIAHLHWHLIPRFVGDSRWGAPPWTTSPDEIPQRRLADADLASMAALIRSELAKT
jgi:diadenosine tetraphosphate (Ap4A) HIT family hydrolase